MFVAGGGLAMRFAEVNQSPGESGTAAITLLRHGFIGNPYMVPTGPTAHVSPVLATYLAGVFAAFGEDTRPARVALGIIAALAFALSARAAIEICGMSSRPGWARWAAAGLVLAVSPMLLYDAAVQDRQWDQPFAALVLVAGWQTFERGRHGGFRPYQAEVIMAALAGIGCLLSPAIFPSLTAAAALLTWMRRRNQSMLAAGMLVTVIMVAFLAPWGLRNQAELGRFIVTRSNFALELAIGNAPGADGTSGSGTGQRLHPHDSPAAAIEMARVGELAYMTEVGVQARHWIAADPVHFARLTLRRLWLCFVPTEHMTGWYPVVGTTYSLAALDALGLLAGLSLLSVAMLGWRRPNELLTPAVLFVALPLAPYGLTHVNLRYLYVTRPDEVVLVVAAAVQVLSAWHARTAA